MEDAALFPELERRPLLFALWFRVLVVTLAAALMGALTIPPVLRWAGGAVTEPTVTREAPTAHQTPAVDAAHSAPHSWMLTSLGLVGGVGLAWVAREVLPRWRRHGDVRAAPATGRAARPFAGARQPEGDPIPVAARQLLREIESSLHQLEQLHSQLLKEVQSDLRRSPELVA
jgi:hypothetical protein